MGAGIGGSSGSATPAGLSLYVCTSNDYDDATKVPTIEDPDETTLYLVPASEDSGNLYDEYVYVNNAWEKFGGGSVDLSNYATLADMNSKADSNHKHDDDYVSKKFSFTPVGFKEKVWNGSTFYPEYGYNVWTDGENIYHDDGYGASYILNKSTNTWEEKVWDDDFKYFYGYYVWTDGENTYYSEYSNQYVFNKLTSTWEEKTWNGIDPSDGGEIWIDGENIYYSNGSY
jgi:hypothetical protein